MTLAAASDPAAAIPSVARPLRWLGGPSEFGLLLPDASPTLATMYAPRGVCITDDAVIVADTGNHRILIWWGFPEADHQDADVVIGQPDATSEGPKLFFLPTGLAVIDGNLVVCDAWHHRVLVFDGIPGRGDARPVLVLGQDDLDGVTEGCGPQRFYWPFGVAMHDGAFWVADTGNRRVLGWSGGLPEPGRAADVVLGQPDLWSRGENRDGPVAANSLRWPHAIASLDGTMVVADAGNHRVLAWHGALTGERPADALIGQPGFTTAVEFPYRPQGPRAFRFPYGVTSAPDGSLFVADTSNNRVARLADAAVALRSDPLGTAVSEVFGQPDTDANGENRWDRVAADSFCWPYGLSCGAGRLAIADSGNNRVTIWEIG